MPGRQPPAAPLPQRTGQVGMRVVGGVLPGKPFSGIWPSVKLCTTINTWGELTIPFDV